MRVEELRRLAEANGISSRFRLADGRRHQVGPETLEAVLRAMGVDPTASIGRSVPAVPAVTVARRGREGSWTPPADALMVLESGEERAPPARLPGDLPLEAGRRNSMGCVRGKAGGSATPATWRGSPADRIGRASCC